MQDNCYNLHPAHINKEGDFVDELTLKQDILEIGRRMYNRKFVAANDGNISVRISENEVLITPSGVSKGYMSVSDIIKVDLDGKKISGSLKPSSEIKMHLAIYKKRNDIGAVVHAHPQKITAFAVAGMVCDTVTLPEVIFSIGKVSFAEYATPTTIEVSRSIEKKVEDSDAIILANHGAVTIGKDVYDAYYKMETLEHFAGISLYARLLGGEKALEPKQVEELFKIRKYVYGKHV
jgi:L-fuculose-phosphate aldolase